MVRDFLVSLSDRSTEYKNEGLVALPAFRKPFLGRLSLFTLSEHHVTKILIRNPKVTEHKSPK
jgi:hypothetical protein